MTLSTVTNQLYYANSSTIEDRIIRFGTRVFENGYFFEPSTYKYVVPLDGIYQFTVYLNIVSPTSGTIKNNIFIEKENPTGGNPEVIAANLGTAPINNFVSCLASLTAGQLVYCTINSVTANSVVTISQAGLISYFTGFLYTTVSSTSTPIF